jgi:hypothetical protein
VAGVPVEIWTQQPPDTSLEHYRQNTLLGSLKSPSSSFFFLIYFFHLVTVLIFLFHILFSSISFSPVLSNLFLLLPHQLIFNLPLSSSSLLARWPFILFFFALLLLSFSPVHMKSTIMRRYLKGVFLTKSSAPRRWCVRWLLSYGNGTRRCGLCDIMAVPRSRSSGISCRVVWYMGTHILKIKAVGSSETMTLICQASRRHKLLSWFAVMFMKEKTKIKLHVPGFRPIKLSPHFSLLISLLLLLLSQVYSPWWALASFTINPPRISLLCFLFPFTNIPFSWSLYSCLPFLKLTPCFTLFIIQSTSTNWQL